MAPALTRLLLAAPLLTLACAPGQGKGNADEEVSDKYAYSVKLDAPPPTAAAAPAPAPLPAPAQTASVPLAAPISVSKEQLLGLAGFDDLVTSGPAVPAEGACVAAGAIPVRRRVRSEVLQKFRAMAVELCRDTGEILNLQSDHRSAPEQRAIWNEKFANAGAMARERGCALPAGGAERRRAIAQCILKFNSMPGTSRHHWGTDIDITNTSPGYWTSGRGARIKAWLDQNAATFGFCQVYAGKASGSGRRGYNDEAWHWSYMPISAPLLSAYAQSVTDGDIITALGGASGGLVVEDITALNIRQDYVMGIADKCRNWAG